MALDKNDNTRTVRLIVNGEAIEEDVEPRYLLVDFLRHRLWLTGTHVGCAHGACGACTILLDDRPARSCLMFAVQVNGKDIRTVESLAPENGLSPLQQEFQKNHALQCGFCTPGMLMAATALLNEIPDPTEPQIREYLAGNLCRCTGYQPIVRAVRATAARLKEEAASTS